MAQHAEDGFGPTNTEASHEEDQKTKAPPLPLEFLAITKDGGELHRYQEGLTPEDLKKPVKILNGIDQAQWTADGQKLAIVHRDRPCQVDLIGVEDEKVYFSCSGASSVVKFCFSPLQTFLLVCFRHDAAAGQHENFCLYRMQNGEKVLSFTLKQINSNTWPPLRWTSQESYCCRMVTNEVHIFKENTFNLNHPYSRIRCENVVSFSPCREKKKTASDPTSSSSSTSDKRPPPPSSANHPCADQEEKSENKEKTPSSSSTAPPPLTCAVFAVGRKGAPSAVKLFDLEDGSRCVSTKSFFQGNEAQFKWSYDGRAVLAQVHTDASDQSYYGSDALYFLKADGSFDCQLVGAAEGPIHDIQWSPTTLEFLLAKGPVPPEVVLYDGSKKVSSPKVSFGRMMRNTLRWDPFARLILTGGFGNLAGDVDVWHKQQKKVVSKAHAPCSVWCELTPDGLHFVTATTSPRLRVDNHLSIYSVRGGHLLHRTDFPVLFHVLPRPPSPSVLPSLNQRQSKALQQYLADPQALAAGLEVPGRTDGSSSKPQGFTPANSGQGVSSSSTVGTTGGAAPTASKGVYRPPSSTGALAARLRAERQATVNSSSLALSRGSTGGGRGGSSLIPGLSPQKASGYPPGYSPPPPTTAGGGGGKKKKK